MQRGTDVLAFGRDWRPEFIVSCESTGAFPGPSWALEGAIGRRERWSSTDLARALDGVDVSLQGRLLSYSMDRAAARAVRQRRLSPCAPPAQLKHRLDHKARTRRLFAEIGLTVPGWREVATGRELSAAASDLGWPLVVQPMRGSSGAGVRLMTSEDSWVASGGSGVLASTWSPGVVLNLHVAVDGQHVVVAPWSVQASGIPALGGGPFTYGGNDFGAVSDLDAGLVAEGQRVGDLVGRRLAQLGWTGIFGLDAIYDGSRLLMLEVNPRLQGSSWLLAEAQALAGRPVLGSAHRRVMLQGAQLDAARDVGAEAPLEGSFVIVRSIDGQAAPCQCLDGAWRLVGDKLLRRGPQTGLVGAHEEDFVVDGTARVRVLPGAVLLRVASRRRLVCADGFSLTGDAARTVQLLRALLEPPRLSGLRPAKAGGPSVAS